MLPKQAAETAAEHPSHFAWLQRCLPANQDSINQLLPLPLWRAQKNQLPPHLRSTKVQPKEYCTCALQDQAATLVPSRHVQQVIDKQRQLQCWATQHLPKALNTAHFFSYCPCILCLISSELCRTLFLISRLPTWLPLPEQHGGASTGSNTARNEQPSSPSEV